MPHHLDESVRHSAISFLAEQAHLPFDEVARIYAHERAELEQDAHVKKFLPIFTFRNVQQQLRLHPRA